ncbi:MAG: SDR family NAD(P)-dependent oxidoreductase [Alphaproteobacteria bacterium]
MTASGTTYDLEGRIAVITGAASGIGYGVAELFLKSGAKVAIWDQDIEGARAACDRLAGIGEAHAFCCDQSVYGEVEVAARETLARFGRVEILVNNAGITGPNTTVADYPVDDWARVIGVDLIGVFHCCRALVPHLVKNGWGRIVNVASVAGKDGNPNASAYSAAKAGVIALTKSLGKELVGTGVLVNCVTPAAVKTAIFEQMSEQHIQYMLSKIPMGRFGTVEENARLIAWLASPDCSFSSGAVFDISGGRSTY